MPKFIGIKQLWYGPVMATAPTGAAALKTLAEGNTFTEVKNVHQDTWGYNQDDPSVDDYINELTGNPYYRDMTDSGRKTINFTMGEYDFQTKADLQGGTVVTSGEVASAKAIGWAAPETPALIEKAIIAKTKTGGWICFTNASIIGKGDQQQKAIGLGVTAVAQDNTNEGVSDEYFFVETA